MLGGCLFWFSGKEFPAAHAAIHNIQADIPPERILAVYETAAQ